MQRFERSLGAFRVGLVLAAIWILGMESGGIASDYQSPRTAALGGAGHAAPLLNDAIYLNPSFSSFLPSYSVSGNLQTFRGSDTYHGRVYNVSLQDGRSDVFQAGAGYTVKENGALVHIGASKSVVQKLGFGLGAKAFFPNSPSGLATRDGTFSTSFVGIESVPMSLVVDNLAETQVGKGLGMYREITLAAKVNIQSMLLLYIDPHFVPNWSNSGEKFGYEIGAELPFSSDVFVRAGMSKNAAITFEPGARGSVFGIGLGWAAPRLSIDYSYTIVREFIAGTQPTPHAHQFGFTAYF